MKQLVSLTLAGLAASALVACTHDASLSDGQETLSAQVGLPQPVDIGSHVTRWKFHWRHDTTATDTTTATSGAPLTTTAPTTTSTAAPAPAPAPAPTTTTTAAPPVPAPTSTATPAPTPTTPPVAARTVPFRGVNLAGAEFGQNIPGTEGYDYQFPTNAEVDYFAAKGMTAFRMGFLWERMQRSLYGAFDATYSAKFFATVDYATSKGLRVILNPHNFARYNGNLIGSSAVPNAAFADFWKRLSGRFASNPNVMFNLVNEPNTMPTEQWVSAANAAIAAIRQAGAHQTIIVPGNGWTGGASWNQNWYGTPNSVAMLNIADPEDNVWFEAHQYLDADAGGTDTTCVSTTAGRDRLAPFVAWLRANNKKGFVGEFAGGNNTTCKTAINDMLTYMNGQGDVLMGWLWWAAGPAWGNYSFSIEPTFSSSGTTDKPLLSWLTPYL